MLFYILPHVSMSLVIIRYDCFLPISFADLKIVRFFRSPILFLCTVVGLFMMMGGETTTRAPDASQETYIKYETVGGYFLQDDDKTDSSKFNFVGLFLSFHIIVLSYSQRT
jgi:hypothetical protein